MYSIPWSFSVLTLLTRQVEQAAILCAYGCNALSTILVCPATPTTPTTQ